MDLQYCDQCGAILQNGEAADATPGEPVVCPACKTIPIREPTGGLGETAHMPGVEVRARKSGAAKVGGGGEAVGIAEDELNLFSAQTIARRKTQPEPQGASRLKIVEGHAGESAGAKSVTRAQAADGPRSETATMVGLRTSVGGSSVAVPRGADKPSAGGGKARSLNLVSDDADAASSSAAASAPRQGALERWKIECLHCNAKLAIQPLEKRSRMHCPRCHGLLIIELNGTVSMPSKGKAGGGGSVAEPRESHATEVVSQLSRLLRSGGQSGGSSWAELPKVPSTAVSKSGSIAVRAGSQAVPKPLSIAVRKQQASGALAGGDAGELSISSIDNLVAKPGAGAAPQAWSSKRTGLAPERVILGVVITAIPTLCVLLLDTYAEQSTVSQLLDKLGQGMKQGIQQALQAMGM